MRVPTVEGEGRAQGERDVRRRRRFRNRDRPRQVARVLTSNAHTRSTVAPQTLFAAAPATVLRRVRRLFDFFTRLFLNAVLW